MGKLGDLTECLKLTLVRLRKNLKNVNKHEDLKDL